MTAEALAPRAVLEKRTASIEPLNYKQLLGPMYFLALFLAALFIVFVAENAVGRRNMNNGGK